jgi:hypothetical protein
MSIFGAIGDVLEDVAGGIGHAVGGIGDALEDVAGSIGKAAKGAAGFLGRAVGDGLDNLADDVKKVQNSLKKLGHFDEEPNGILSKSLDAAIRGFQRESGLKVDGKLLPGGETEREIYKKRTGRDPNAIWAPADDGREIGFGQAYTNFRDRGLLGTLGAIGSAITDGVDSLTDGDPETNPWSTQKKTGREWEEATTAQSIAKYKAEKAAEAAAAQDRYRRKEETNQEYINLGIRPKDPDLIITDGPKRYASRYPAPGQDSAQWAIEEAGKQVVDAGEYIYEKSGLQNVVNAAKSVGGFIGDVAGDAADFLIESLEGTSRNGGVFSVLAPPLAWGPWTEVFGYIGMSEDYSTIVDISFSSESNAPFPFDYEIKGGDSFIRTYPTIF